MNAGRGPVSDEEKERQREVVVKAEAYRSKAWGQQKQWKYVALHVGVSENELRYLRDKIKREKRKGEK